MISHWFAEGIRSVGVEDLVSPHDDDEIFGVGEVDDVVGVAGEHVDGLDVVAADFKFDGVVGAAGGGVGADLAFLDEAVAGDDDEEFPFGVVPVLAFGDAGFGDVDADLAVAAP